MSDSDLHADIVLIDDHQQYYPYPLSVIATADEIVNLLKPGHTQREKKVYTDAVAEILAALVLCNENPYLDKDYYQRVTGRVD
jgi:hypothetical protein